jgi:hypothetical protein
MKNERRRWKAGAGLIGLAVALGWLTGCTSPDVLQKDYGNAMQNNMAQSVLNPQAGLLDTPTTGLHPKAAVNEMDGYNKSFTGEPKGISPTTVAPTGVSAGGGAGAGAAPGQ